MSALEAPSLLKDIETRVRACTGSRLSNLGVELSADGVRLHGQTTTYHVKQLAQHCVRTLLPHVSLVNEIHVISPLAA